MNIYITSLFGLALALIPIRSTAIQTQQTAQQTSVYICTGKSAKVYHSSKTCGGLNRCGSEIIKVSKAKAESIGRRPCMKCY